VSWGWWVTRKTVVPAVLARRSSMRRVSADVLGDRPGVQPGILRDEGDQVAQHRQRDAPDVAAVDGDPPGVRVG
jgi:hypothetical protein